MRDLYNKSALDKIATMDQLDKAIVLVSPSLWVSILGAFLIITGLILWGYLGSIPSTVDVNGIYMSEDGICAQYAQNDGIITNVRVRVGDKVNPGDILANIGTEDDYYKLQQLDQRVSYVENITFDSDFDVVTKDTEALAQIKLNADHVGNAAVATDASLDLKKARLKEMSAEVEARKTEMLAYKEAYYATLAITDDSHELLYSEANSDYGTHFSLYETAKSTYISNKEQYYTKLDEFNAKYKHFDHEHATSEEIAAYDAEYADLQSIANQAEDYRILMEAEGKKLELADSNLDSARKTYMDYLREESSTRASNTIASTEYSESLNAYSTALSQYRALQGEVDDLELKAVADHTTAQNDETNYKLQFDNQKSAILSDLQLQREDLLNDVNKSMICANSTGEIYDIDINVGMTVNEGTKVLSMMPNAIGMNEVICYVPLADAKSLKEGMAVHVYPSTVNKQEYGHIEGFIKDINTYVETTENMKDQLGSDSLVQDFSKKGPVIAVHCGLEEDSFTVSGYKWSSQKGQNIPFSTGTLISATVVTGEKRPIDVFIPYIKEKLEFKIKNDKQS